MKTTSCNYHRLTESLPILAYTLHFFLSISSFVCASVLFGVMGMMMVFASSPYVEQTLIYTKLHLVEVISQWNPGDEALPSYLEMGCYSAFE